MPRPVRIVLLVLLIAIAVTVLFTTIFPRVERMLEQDPTIGTATAGTATAPYEVRSPS